MIVSTHGKRAKDAVKGVYGKRFPPDLVNRTNAMLHALDAAKELKDLASPPGNQLEPMRGDRKGQHSIRLNDQWRICFVWTDQGPSRVEIEDYH